MLRLRSTASNSTMGRTGSSPIATERTCLQMPAGTSFERRCLSSPKTRIRYAARFADFYSVAIRWPSVTARMTTWAGLPGHSTGNPAQVSQAGGIAAAGPGGGAPLAGPHGAPTSPAQAGAAPAAGG